MEQQSQIGRFKKSRMKSYSILHVIIIGLVVLLTQCNLPKEGNVHKINTSENYLKENLKISLAFSKAKKTDYLVAIVNIRNTGNKSIFVSDLSPRTFELIFHKQKESYSGFYSASSHTEPYRFPKQLHPNEPLTYLQLFKVNGKDILGYTSDYVPNIIYEGAASFDEVTVYYYPKSNDKVLLVPDTDTFVIKGTSGNNDKSR